MTKLVPFGAFVRVAQGIEGLVHISELSDQHVESPESVLTVGDEVRVKVIDVDVSRRRISLSMRQVGGQPLQPKEAEIEAEAGPDGEPPEEPAEPTEPMAPAPDFADMEQAVAAVNEPEAGGAEPAAAAEPQAGGGGEPAPATTEPAAPAAEEAEPAAAQEDVSLESILADLKRREGRD